MTELVYITLHARRLFALVLESTVPPRKFGRAPSLSAAVSCVWSMCPLAPFAVEGTVVFFSINYLRKKKVKNKKSHTSGITAPLI